MPKTTQAHAKKTAELKATVVSRETAAATSSADHLSTRSGPPLRAVKSVPLDAPYEAGRAPILAHATDRRYEALKRIFDLFVGLLLLIIAAPIILIAAACIRVETKGSPFFIQKRLGKNGKSFRIVKLRGMFIDSRIRFASYYDYSRHRDLEFCFHHEEDPRVTRAGKFIRKTSIDELPNLWNVVLGDMSLVGPRPEIPEVLDLYGPYRDAYLSVKPGVTCLSKCTGRDRLTKRETIEFDLNYIRQRSFLLDMKILWKTFYGVVLRRDVF